MEYKTKKSIKIILNILLLIMILSIVSFLYFGRLNDYVPTGNVDIFYIDVGCLECTNDNCSNDRDISENVFSEKDYEKFPVFSEDDNKYVLGEIFIDDKNGNYIYQQKLNVFTNPAYEMKEIIAPGSTNTYHFVVHNKIDTKIKYQIEMIEKTEYDINMKYRLKLDNEYVVGDEDTWVYANDLRLSSINLGENELSVYALEWKWFDSENDSMIGKNMESLYQLNIRINFESVEE